MNYCVKINSNQNHNVTIEVSYEFFFFFLLDRILRIENFNQIAYIINIELFEHINRI